MEEIKNFLDIPYDQLEELNLNASKFKTAGEAEKNHREYLEKEKGIKALTVSFSDIEGRLHMLDYDKKYLLKCTSNLTFDGSSIRGFTAQNESDLRLSIDWLSLRWLPSDIFGPGKVIVFAEVLNPDKTPYENDFRTRLKSYLRDLKTDQGLEPMMGPEIEGFLLEGIDAEQNFDSRIGFKMISSGGYYHSLPLDRLRKFIDSTAEAQRAMGFENEKDHPEVAPSQFEINFRHCDVIRACDQVQLYKLVCRQVANNMGLTATFLPKPIQNINGSGMHTNLSLSKDGKNVFYSEKGKDGLSEIARDFIERILNHAPEICLTLNSSVNSYRRLDPHFEAPNQIKVTPNDRGSMIRIPSGDLKSARIEIRSVAPDANPYLALYTILRTGLEGEKISKADSKKSRLRFLPGTINDAIRIYKGSDFITKILGNSKDKYLEPKQAASDRNPKELGKTIKESEIIYHHEITNQSLWNAF
jgi:glutamine synthetase